MLCQVPRSGRPPTIGTTSDGLTIAGSTVVGAVPGGAVVVEVAVVAGEQPLERGHEIVLRAAGGLHEGHARGGVGREDVDEPVASSATEGAHLVGDVDDLPIGGVDLDFGPLHGSSSTSPAHVVRPAPGRDRTDGIHRTHRRVHGRPLGSVRSGE